MLATRGSEGPRLTGKILRRLPAPRGNPISVGLRATVNEAIEMAGFKDIADILLPIRREHAGRSEASPNAKCFVNPSLPAPR
jgi:hypothetical protein